MAKKGLIIHSFTVFCKNGTSKFSLLEVTSAVFVYFIFILVTFKILGVLKKVKKKNAYWYMGYVILSVLFVK